MTLSVRFVLHETHLWSQPMPNHCQRLRIMQRHAKDLGKSMLEIEIVSEEEFEMQQNRSLGSFLPLIGLKCTRTHSANSDPIFSQFR